MNDGVAPNFFQGCERSYKLPTAHDLAQLIIESYPDSLLWKTGLERAYWQLRSDPLDYPLMGISHRGAYSVDVCSSFWCWGSGAAQQRVSTTVCHLMAGRAHPILAYVEDFCGIHNSYLDAVEAFADFEALCSTLPWD